MNRRTIIIVLFLALSAGRIASAQTPQPLPDIRWQLNQPEVPDDRLEVGVYYISTNPATRAPRAKWRDADGTIHMSEVVTDLDGFNTLYGPEWTAKRITLLDELGKDPVRPKNARPDTTKEQMLRRLDIIAATIRKPQFDIGLGSNLPEGSDEKRQSDAAKEQFISLLPSCSLLSNATFPYLTGLYGGNSYVEKLQNVMFSTKNFKDAQVCVNFVPAIGTFVGVWLYCDNPSGIPTRTLTRINPPPPGAPPTVPSKAECELLVNGQKPPATPMQMFPDQTADLVCRAIGDISKLQIRSRWLLLKPGEKKEELLAQNPSFSGEERWTLGPLVTTGRYYASCDLTDQLAGFSNCSVPFEVVRKPEPPREITPPTETVPPQPPVAKVPPKPPNHRGCGRDCKIVIAVVVIGGAVGGACAHFCSSSSTQTTTTCAPTDKCGGPGPRPDVIMGIHPVVGIRIAIGAPIRFPFRFRFGR